MPSGRRSAVDVQRKTGKRKRRVTPDPRALLCWLILAVAEEPLEGLLHPLVPATVMTRSQALAGSRLETRKVPKKA